MPNNPLSSMKTPDFAKGMDGANNTEFLFAGLVCAYASISTKDILIGLQSGGEFLCIELHACIAGNAKAYEMKFDANKANIGLNSERYLLASLPCCELQIKKPQTIIASKTKLLPLFQDAVEVLRKYFEDKPMDRKF